MTKQNPLQTVLTLSAIIALLTFIIMALCIARYVSFLTIELQQEQMDIPYPHSPSHEEAGWKTSQA